MDKELGELVGKGFALLRDRLRAVEARKALDGIDGQDGADGIDGSNGTDGTNGIDGKAGVDGKDGADGLRGKAGDSVKGDQGVQGDQGNKGETGDQGEAGEAGQIGPQGERGPQGNDGQALKGDKGDKGDDGGGITSAAIDANGNLIITLDNGQKLNAGKAKGKDARQFQGMIATGPTAGISRSVVLVTDASQLAGNLDSTKLYLLDGQIDLREVSIIVPPGGLSMAGQGFGVSGLISTSDNYSMFVRNGTYTGDLILTSMDITCTGIGSKVFDLDNQENLGTFNFNSVNFIQCTSLGIVANYRQGLATGVAWIRCLDGLTMAGNWLGGFAVVDSVVVGNTLTGVLFRAGLGLLIAGSFRSNINILALSSVGGLFCDFAPANIVLDGGFALSGVRARVNTNTVPNMPASSTKAFIRDCVGISDTYPGGVLTPVADSEIIITDANTLFQITGAMTLSEAYWFSLANTNGLQANSTKYTEVNCVGIMSFSGSNGREMGVQLRKYDNSTASYINIGPSYRITLNGGGAGTRAENISFKATTNLEAGDRVEVWIENFTDASNITLLAGGQFQVLER